MISMGRSFTCSTQRDKTHGSLTYVAASETTQAQVEVTAKWRRPIRLTSALSLASMTRANLFSILLES